MHILLRVAAQIVTIEGRAPVEFLNSSNFQIINQGNKTNSCSGLG